MNEIWKDILNYEDQYQVSNLGRIRSKDRLVNAKGNATRLVRGSVMHLLNYLNQTLNCSLFQYIS